MRLSASLLLLPFLAVPAYAAGLDEPIVTPEPVVLATPAPLWAGFYAGAQVGYGWATTSSVDVDNDNNLVEDVGDAVRDIGRDGNGWIGGVNAGYLWQTNNWVYGAEAEYDWAEIELDSAGGEIQGIGLLKAKAGYAFDSGVLLYGVGGATYGDAKIAGDDFNDWGWTLGAGVDYFVTDTITIGAEALFQQWDEFDDSGVDVDITTLVARVAYHF